jgi:Kef-type K+ transport system membrane component KefB/voltage-gated potassium channel Kch
MVNDRMIVKVGFLVGAILHKQAHGLQLVHSPHQTLTRHNDRFGCRRLSWNKSSSPQRQGIKRPISALSLADPALLSADSLVVTIQHTLQPLWTLLTDSATHLFSSVANVGHNVNDVTKPSVVIPPSLEELATSEVLESMGQDLLLFFAATVVVVPLFSYWNLSPILGYLIAGAILGPHALDLFRNSRADIEMGDFGILFLLFSEGLEISSPRLKKLMSYLPLGLAQMTLTAGVLSATLLLGPDFLDRFLPLDSVLINHIKETPVEVLVLALAGTLSTSAFVFPVLKEKEWEVEASGEAATSILLLQDLAVAPLLVLLPYMAAAGGVADAAGNGMAAMSASSSMADIGFLTLKATIGFGSVIAVGSFVLRKIFSLVAQSKSSETFAALCLLVAAGMGATAKMLGLTDTAGAFAAGVLLANTNYRAQIQADILPFKGILLGIFFMDAGGSFDFDLVLRELPTVLTGAFSLIILKAVTLWAATKAPEWIEPNRLPNADAVKLSILLAGGGEFALVVLALAEKVHIVPNIENLEGILTAIILATMALTPFLGEMADWLSNAAKTKDALANKSNIVTPISAEYPVSEVASDAIVVCGYDEMGQTLLSKLGTVIMHSTNGSTESLHDSAHLNEFVPHVVAFDNNPSLFDLTLFPTPNTFVLYGDGGNPQVLRSTGILNPSAIIVSYHDHDKVYSATARLRAAFVNSPIYARANTRSEAQRLRNAGATEVIVEADELSRSAVALLLNEGILQAKNGLNNAPVEMQRYDIATPNLSNIIRNDTYNLVEWFECLDVEGKGYINAEDLVNVLRKTYIGIMTDDEIEQLDLWLNKKPVKGPLNCLDFCRLVSKAPVAVQDALSEACLVLPTSATFNQKKMSQ